MIHRYLGGEASGRSLFGGRRNKARSVGLGVAGFGAAVLVMYFQTAGLVVGMAAVGAVYLGTASTHFGSPLQRWQSRRRWREQTRRGMRRFVPVERRPAVLTEQLGAPARSARRDALQEAAAYRDWPDGVEGMQWLSCEPGRPGIIWHTPTGEEPYLSVIFPLAGQVRGLESDQVVDSRAAAFGVLLAGWASPRALPGRVQMLTRVLPVDSARHEAWVLENVDPAAPRALLESYDDVVRQLGRGGLMQRHYAVVRWPLGPQFLATAARRGEGQAGWEAVMAQEVASVRRRLAQAHLRPGPALSAGQAAALLRHLQLPSWPLEQAGDVRPMWPWMSSQEAWSYVHTQDVGPTGEQEEWLHRTARIPIEGVSTGARTPLWLMPLVAQMPHRIIRSISIELEPVPAARARTQAGEDLTSDLADLEARRRKGHLGDDELEVSASAARARRHDLRPGSGHHGLGWAFHLGISARSVEDLTEASVQIEEVLTSDMDIADLEWLDGQQAAAQALVWPVARGTRPMGLSLGSRLRSLLAGTGHKEALT